MSFFIFMQAVDGRREKPPHQPQHPIEMTPVIRIYLHTLQNKDGMCGC